MQPLDWARRLAWPVEPGALRLWLALLVFVHHLTRFNVGLFAVYAFFALSGYWLQGMWQRRYSHARSPYTTYVVSRLWRLAPVMVTASLVTIPIQLALAGDPAAVIAQPLHLAVSSTVLLGYAQLDFLPVGPAWSLDVEAQFYLLVPVLALFVSRLPVWVSVSLAAVVSLAASVLFTTDVLPKYLAFFIIGMVTAAQGWQPSNRLANRSALLTVAIVAGLALSPWNGVILGGAERGPLFIWNPMFNIALAIVALPFVLATVYRPSDATDRAFGDLSYPVYLLHWAATIWMFTLVLPLPLRALAALCSLGAVMAVSLLVWKVIDRPLNRARERWVAGRTSIPPAQPTMPSTSEIAGP